ncbi:MAG: 1,5-anhydro-D-fructose reductase [Firmicutes bacterium ADurb.Bin300]|nr:MAG: 1,5-anhydro-D-fructose reductase [Firmicutes bacterium ADurb.Bin300]
MDNNIRWGIVGTGTIARRFAVAAKNTLGASLNCVASRSIDTANAFADEFGIEKRFGSYEAMAKSTDIDAAYIAVPHGIHAFASKLMLNNKKAVLCEKPICVNEQELLDLIECAKTNNTFLMEAMWARLVPGTIELIGLVNDGIIGKVRGIEGDFCYDMTDEPEHHAFKPEYGGGSLLDVGVYALNFASWFARSPVSKITALADIGKRTRVDEHCCILVKYEDGLIASLSSAMTVKKPNSGYIYGEKGFIHVDHFYAPEKLEITIFGKESKTIVKPYYGNGFEEQIAHVGECLNKGKTQSDILPLSHSLYITRQMDLIRGQIGVTYPQDS